MTTRRSRRLTFGLLMGVLSQLAAIGLLLASAWLIVRAAEQPPVLYLIVAIVSVRFFGISRAVLRYVERLYTHDVAFADATGHRIEAYRELDRVAPQGLAGSRRGDLVSRVVSDVQTMQDRLLRLRLPWWIGISATVVVISIIALIDRGAGLVLALSAVMVAASIRLVVSRIASRGGTSAVQSRGLLSTQLSEIVLAAPDLVAYDATGPARQRSRDASAQLASDQLRSAGASGLGTAMALALTGVAIAVLAVVSEGIDPVLVGVVLLAPLALAEPLEAWADAERLRPDVASAKDRLAELATMTTSVVEPQHPTPLPQAWDLVAEGLRVGWQEPLTDVISFHLPEGTACAITGPSGIGKSTLAYSLLRLVEPHEGSIRLGGVDLRSVLGEDVRRRIGYLGQDDIVFDTSIRENLRIARPQATDTQMHDALARAGLKDFLASLSSGLDTLVGEAGSKLSGGERQRLCMARLILADHRVLILDEPTEHLDADAAERLLDDVLQLCPDRSIMVISHAASVLDRFGDVIDLSRSPASSQVGV